MKKYLPTIFWLIWIIWSYIGAYFYLKPDKRPNIFLDTFYYEQAEGCLYLFSLASAPVWYIPIKTIKGIDILGSRIKYGVY